MYSYFDGVCGEPDEPNPDVLDPRHGAEDEEDDQPAVDDVVEGKDGLRVDEDNVQWIGQGSIHQDVSCRSQM